jgi:hypothetical protein
MNENDNNPRPVVIDVGRTALHTAEQALSLVVVAASLFIVVALLLALMVGAVAGAIAGVACIGFLCGKLYRTRPQLTAGLIIALSTVLCVIAFMGNYMTFGFAMVAMAVYGFIILPDGPIDLSNKDIVPEKLNSIAIAAVLTMFLGGFFVGGSVWHIMYVLDKTMPTNAIAFAFCTLVGPLSLYHGYKHSNRQRNYLANPKLTLAEWQQEIEEERIKETLKVVAEAKVRLDKLNAPVVVKEESALCKTIGHLFEFGPQSPADNKKKS